MPVNIDGAGSKKSAAAAKAKAKVAAAAGAGLDALIEQHKNEPEVVQQEAVAAIEEAVGIVPATEIADEAQSGLMPLAAGQVVDFSEPEASPADKIGDLVDELADLMAWDAEQKKDTRYKRLADLKTLFANEADLVDADEIVTFEGHKHTYQLGKKSTVRSINPDGGKAKIIEMIGAEQFLELASIKLADVDAYLTPPQKTQVLVSERGGRSGKMLDKN